MQDVRVEGAAVMTRSNGNDLSPEGDGLARLKLAATTAEEAARWLRNSLVRLRTGHDVEFEIRSAEQALQAALERIRGDADGSREPSERRGADEDSETA